MSLLSGGHVHTHTGTNGILHKKALSRGVSQARVLAKVVLERLFRVFLFAASGNNAVYKTTTPHSARPPISTTTSATSLGRRKQNRLPRPRAETSRNDARRKRSSRRKQSKKINKKGEFQQEREREKEGYLWHPRQNIISFREQGEEKNTI